MNGGVEIPGEFVVSGGDATKVLEPTKAALDDVAPFVGLLVEAVALDPVGFVGNDDLGSAFADFGAQGVAIIALVGEQRTHGGRLRQHIGRRRDVGILAGRQVQDDGPALWIGQSVDFRRASAPRAPDSLCVLPPFPPEAQR